jgi:3' terminal RNA ribose 2'-O-methyltransferase Hen1
MSSAIARIFGTAMSGRCDKRQELADSALDLSAAVTMLPCHGDTAMIEKIFAPLGYRVEVSGSVLEEHYPEWGESRYVNLTIGGKVRLRELLRHLYVLLPVFDRQKHYWVGSDEIDKLFRHGEGWLEQHPEKAFITRRYLYKSNRLTRLALDRLDNGESGALEAAIDAEPVKKNTLNDLRLHTVVELLKENKAQSVIDLGCGEGKLLQLLLAERGLLKIAGAEVSFSVLERAKERLRIENLPEFQQNRVQLFQSSITYKDERFSGYDAATVVEVLEHLDLDRLPAFAESLFGQAKPPLILLTTPNAEYNELYEGLSGIRHSDHRFEWSRAEFRVWGDKIAEQYGYAVTYIDVGEIDEQCGSPTQMGVFKLCV